MDYGFHVLNLILTLGVDKGRICHKNCMCILEPCACMILFMWILKPCEGVILGYLYGFSTLVWNTFTLFNGPSLRWPIVQSWERGVTYCKKYGFVDDLWVFKHEYVPTLVSSSPSSRVVLERPRLGGEISMASIFYYRIKIERIPKAWERKKWCYQWFSLSYKIFFINFVGESPT